MSKRSQSYGPKSRSAVVSMSSTAANSHAAASTTDGSAHTRERGPTSRPSSSPTANASRYGGIGCGIAQSPPAVSAAAISTRSPAGTESSRVVGDAHARRVLQRHDRARVDRLALREEERVHAARRLRRRQPLQRRRVRRGPIANPNGALAPERDAQARAEDRLGLRQLPRQRSLAVFDTVDEELARVEIDDLAVAAQP